jgi:RNA polymerase sigma-70 factor (ECF subfamily)
MKTPMSEKHTKFKASMTPHMDQMYNYAMYLTGDREEANDLLQETFLKAYRFYDKYEEGTNAKAWLYRIMRNTYINEYRRVKRLPDLVEFDEQISAPYFAGQPHRAGSELHGELFGDEIASAIARLPEKFKSVILLRDIEDLPYEEIAEALDIPVGTVRSRLHRARAILFERLRAYAEDRGYAVSDRFEPAELALAV